jgi:hypothetical protein
MHLGCGPCVLVEQLLCGIETRSMRGTGYLSL